jgi:hypothetical protein
MIENILTPLVSFAGSGVAGFFMGMFLRRVLKFLVVISWGCVLGYSMDAGASIYSRTG